MTMNDLMNAGILIEREVKIYTYHVDGKKEVLFKTNDFLKYGDEINFCLAEREITALIGRNGLEIEV